MLIPNPDIVFLNSEPETHFWANLGQKSQSYQFCLKIGTQSLSRMLILILSLVFWNSYPRFILGQIWAEKVKVVCFAWKLAYGISWGCWVLLRHYFSEFPTLNPFLGKFGLKKLKLLVCLKSNTCSISRMLIPFLMLIFSNFKPKSRVCWFLFWD